MKNGIVFNFYGWFIVIIQAVVVAYLYHFIRNQKVGQVPAFINLNFHYTCFCQSCVIRF